MYKKLALLFLSSLIIISASTANAADLSGRIIFSSKRTKMDHGDIYYEYILRVKDSHNKFQTLYLRTEKNSTIQLALEDTLHSNRIVFVTYYKRGTRKHVISILPAGSSSKKIETFSAKNNVRTATSIENNHSVIVGTSGITINNQ